MTYKTLPPTNSFVFDIKHENQHMSLNFNTKNPREEIKATFTMCHTVTKDKRA